MSDANLLPSNSIQGLARTLSSLGMEFALVGGVAVALAATPRFTADIDAVLLDLDHRLEWFFGEMERAGYTPRTSDPIGFARRTRVMTLRDPFGVGIDLMLGLLPFDQDLVRKANRVPLESGDTVPVATPEHLIVMKAIAWRPRDQQDIRDLVAMNPGLDGKYVIRELAKFLELLEVPERLDEVRKMIASA